MDELLYDEYCLEPKEGSNFGQIGLSSSSTSIFSSYRLATSETDMDYLNQNPYQKSNQGGRERSHLGDNPFLLYPQMDELVGSRTQNWEFLTAASSGQLENFLFEVNEASRRSWIAPSANPSPNFSVKKRLMKAIEYLREFTRDRDVLIQIWVPIKRGGRHVLSTNNQPFSVSPNCKNLVDYRDISSSYQFAAEENSKDFVGLPGRVFLKKLPEWTPDVRFFRMEEDSRVSYAQKYNVSGSLALPFFERTSRTCLGVVEIVTTTQKVNYRPEFESACKALEAVGLRSFEILSLPIIKVCDDYTQAALTEIKEVLKSACHTHGLPLALSWAPCIQQCKAGCRHSDENYARCVSTVDSACYVLNPQVLGFHEACSEHHLLRGEGIAGGAFMTNQPCFATDITAFSKTEYPLSHYARMFGLRASVGIRLRSIFTGSADFVLEFFLPTQCQDVEEQRLMLSSLSSVIQQVCCSLRVVTDQELAEETTFPERENFPLSGGILDEDNTQKLVSSVSKEPLQEDSFWTALTMESQQKGKAGAVSLGYQKEEPEEEFIVAKNLHNNESQSHHGKDFSGDKQIHQDSGPTGSAESGGDLCSVGKHLLSGARQPVENRRTKNEKTISLQVLRQYFSGSLKDAAKSIGVCPTTLKRICRQHGITRWPSRKIKKVGHSLRKLQLVIDSVHGVEGAIQLDSFYSNFPELSSPNLPGISASTSKMNDQLKQLNTQPAANSFSPVITSKSPSSSCSRSSNSSFCCSMEAKQPPVPVNALGGAYASVWEGHPGWGQKRAHSDTELHGSGQEETKLLIRSYSHKLFSETPNLEALPPLQKTGSHVLQDGCGFKFKATFGEEKIRFSMQRNLGFGDLVREVGKRFSLGNSSRIDIKYLDDDSEWVLLTCDADLEECLAIQRLSRNRIIKLLVHQAFNLTRGSSIGSSSPSQHHDSFQLSCGD
ncbi:hypothetical protein U1Q18_036230 [Sarracenia purpurea var. burkii]